MPDPTDRRAFLVHAAAAASFAVVPATLVAQSAATKPKKEKDDDEVTTNEDLMREHGVLRRVLLIYDHIAEQISAKQDVNPAIITQTAMIVRTFVEDYHEKMEQDYLFPRFRRANKMVDLVEVLLQQHQAGRALTERIRTAASGDLKGENGTAIVTSIREFQRMYRPHAAREDTVLFPAFKKIVSPHEYDALGEQFEKIEQQQLGQDGFEKYLAKVEDIEKQLGIYDLTQFTPKV